MKLVDLEQQIFVSVVDETHGGVTVEMKMTVGEFFGKFCQGFEPEVIEAIPVEWLREFDLYYAGISGGTPYMNALIETWKGQEAIM
jgi:hypothetical protein